MKLTNKKLRKLTVRIKIDLWKRLLNVPFGYIEHFSINSLVNKLIEEELNKLGY